MLCTGTGGKKQEKKINGSCWTSYHPVRVCSKAGDPLAILGAGTGLAQHEDNKDLGGSEGYSVAHFLSFVLLSRIIQ